MNNKMNNKLYNFYINNGYDNSKRTFNQILQFNYLDLELEHDYIQWIFPTIESSKAVPDSPVLDQETIYKLTTNMVANSNLEKAYYKLDKFYLLSHPQNCCYGWWARKPNHNLARISRILNSLKTLERPDLAEQFFNKLLKVNLNNVPLDSINRWKRILNYN
jgi:hypothetical protein